MQISISYRFNFYGDIHACKFARKFMSEAEKSLSSHIGLVKTPAMQTA